MFASMLTCYVYDVCACALASSFVYVWLANGVLPCCRLCRLGHCRVTQIGRSAGAPYTGVILVDGYFRRIYMLCFVVLSSLYKPFDTYIYQFHVLVLICLCLVVRSVKLLSG